MDKNIRKYVGIFILGLIIFFILVNNYIWIKLYSSRIILQDEASHLIQNIEFYKIFKDFSLQKLTHWWHYGSRIYPPFFAFITALINLFFGFSKAISIMANGIYLVILVISVYLIGKKISSDRAGGLLSAFLITIYPLVFSIQRWYLLDFSLMAMVSLSVWCLLSTENFTNRGKAFFLGFVMGLGLLTKQAFPLFIVGPFLYLGIQSMKKTRSSLINIVIAISMSLVVSLIYFNHPISMLKDMFSPANYFYVSLSPLNTDWRTFEGFTFYLRSLPYQLSPVFTVFFIFSLFFFFKIRYRSVLFLWIVVPLVILTFIPNKWARYLLPSLSPIAIITAAGIMKIPPRKIKRIAVVSVIIIGITQYFLISYTNIGYHHQSFSIECHPPLYKIRFSKEIERFVTRDIFSLTQKRKDRINIGVIELLDFGKIESLPLLMQANTLKYIAYRENINCKIISFIYKFKKFLVLREDINFLILCSLEPAPWPLADRIIKMARVEKVRKLAGSYYGEEFQNLKDEDYLRYRNILGHYFEKFELIKMILIPFGEFNDKALYLFIFRNISRDNV